MKKRDRLAKSSSKPCHGLGQAGRKGFVAHPRTSQHGLFVPILEAIQVKTSGFLPNPKTAVRSLGERFTQVWLNREHSLAKLLRKFFLKEPKNAMGA
jgi:hypothetical protein